MRFVLILITILLITNCQNKTGLYVDYFDNGDSLSLYNYRNDTLNGPYKLFYPGNVIKEQGSFVKGIKKGKCLIHYPNGDLKEYIFYKFDGLPFYHKIFNESGKLIEHAIPIGTDRSIEQDTVETDKPFHLSFKLEHSMYEKPRLGMAVFDVKDDKFDLIAELGSDTTIVEYDIILKKGVNRFQVNLFEYSEIDMEVKGQSEYKLEFFGK
jgi:hypothetical protein